MVRYADPEDHPELGPDDGPGRRSSPGERLARARERNSALTGVEAVEAAREVALRQLDSRPRSRMELRAVVVSRGFSEDLADEVLDRLEAVGLVDDAAYAQALVRERFRTGKVGRAVVEELRRRGLSADVIEAATAQVDRDDEESRARELVEGRLATMDGVDRERAWRRLTSMLARKGYPPGLCSSVVSQALSERTE